MFHAAGWTFPWAITCAFATQASISMDIFGAESAWLIVTSLDNAQNGRLLSHLETLPSFEGHSLLWRTHGSGMTGLFLHDGRLFNFENNFENNVDQIGIVNHPDARRLPQPVTAVIAGAAPTAHLLGELEQKGIQPVHVYGLT